MFYMTLNLFNNEIKCFLRDHDLNYFNLKKNELR